MTDPAPLVKRKSILKAEASDGEDSRRDSKRLSVSFTVDVREHSRDAQPGLDEPDDLVEQLLEGSMLAIIQGRKIKERHYFYDPDTNKLCWYTNAKKKAIKSIPLKQIGTVVMGKSAPDFYEGEAASIAPWLCFSILPEKKGAPIHLAASTADEAQLWVFGLRQLKRDAEKLEKEVEIRADWVRSLFEQAADDWGRLDKKGCVRLLQALLPWLREDVVGEKFQNVIERRRQGSIRLFSSMNLHGNKAPVHDAGPVEEEQDENKDQAEDGESTPVAKTEEEEFGFDMADQESDAVKAAVGGDKATEDDAKGEGQNDTNATGDASAAAIEQQDGAPKGDVDQPSDAQGEAEAPEHVDPKPETVVPMPQAGPAGGAPEGIDLDTLQTDKIESAQPHGGSDTLSLAEFYGLFRRLATRREIYFVLSRYSDAGGAVLTRQGLRTLLELEQEEMALTEPRLAELIDRNEPIPLHAKAGVIGLDGLTRLFMREYTLGVRSSPLKQDMTRPLHHYFILSSYNTYLSGDQVSSECTTANYRKALAAGCRAIEIDLWDSTDTDKPSRPIILHGHTKTAPIELDAVLPVIKAGAFERTDLPLLLIIEMHCTADNQKVAAQKLVDTFGKGIVTLSAEEYSKSCNEGTVPSLADLKKRVIVISQKTGPEAFSKGEDEDINEHDEFAFYLNVKKRRNQRNRRPGSEEPTEVAKISVTHDYSKVVSMPHYFAKDVDVDKANGSSLATFNEKDAVKQIEADATKIIQRSRKQLVRIFPADSRTNSDNPEFMPFMACGVQLVSMNWQTDDVPLRTIRAMFDGSGGFLLKPAFLLSDPPGAETFNPCADSFPSAVPTRYTITIVSAQQLCTPVRDKHRKGAAKKPQPTKQDDKANGSADKKPNDAPRIVDPFVAIEVMGVPVDAKEFTTRAIDNNSFDPYWNEVFTFDIQFPPLALLAFEVLDNDIGGESFIGSAAVPVTELRPGFHTLPLRHVNGAVQEGSSLFIHVAVDADLGAVPATAKPKIHGLHDFHDANAADGMPAKKRGKQTLKVNKKASDEESQETAQTHHQRTVGVIQCNMTKAGVEAADAAVEEVQRLIEEVNTQVKTYSTALTALARLLTKDERSDIDTVAQQLERLFLSVTQAIPLTVEPLGDGVRMEVSGQPTKATDRLIKAAKIVSELSQAADMFTLRLGDFKDAYPDLLKAFTQAAADNASNAALTKNLEELERTPTEFQETEATLHRQLELVKSVAIRAKKHNLLLQKN